MIEMRDPEVIESLKYLQVTDEERMKTQARPFDGKRSCWVPDAKEGFIAGEIVEDRGDLVGVKTQAGVVDVRRDQIEQMNPPKYEKCEDMADLTYLNDATVLHNLRSRYKDWLIYTYSGLFCVAINPYHRLPIYTQKMVNFYRGKKKTEVPPHLFYVADNAYASMLKDRENQSILITGESGAGKTENTKKVIQYFALVASSHATGSAKSSQKGEATGNHANLEDQIISANPVLEAYGNAKTTRNNNSSRFGKFIRIHFGPSGKIAGADIESYLLEKSRVTFQQSAERNYHIFYQLLSPAFPVQHADLLISAESKKYFYINQGVLTIDNVNDADEMRLTDEAFDILNFTKAEKLNLFKCTAAILHFGNSSWKQRPREEQADTDGTEECEKVSHLLGIESPDLLKGLLKPRIKVGNEYVNKGQSRDQVINAIGALSKSIYSRCFAWLVERVNATLDVKSKREYFIGVLDIAGFEIFDFNSFEQLCINFTNERLQQFFNHHMFVLEQQEYQNEGISWEMMNFGLDLQACIDLIEKPMGIFSILEEECIVPKASDKTFQEKLYSNHLGKHPNFGKPKLVAKSKSGSSGSKGAVGDEVHFELHHYAGTVGYSVNGWLEKNKDPINTTVAALFKESKSNELLAYLYRDHGNDDNNSSNKGKKTGAMMTISSGHREQLNKLMTTLRETHPHFVRCIIPNELKTGGILDAHLVMHQLHCNGVLEGIRICRKGFPNRMIYTEFKQRYSVLATSVLPASFQDAVKSTSAILDHIALDKELYRLGSTKIFFRAGVLGQLEDLRDSAVSNVVRRLQAQMRAFLVRNRYKTMLDQKLAVCVLQRNTKKYLAVRNWAWWRLYTKMKPLLSVARQEEEIKAREEELVKLQETVAREETRRKELEEQSVKLLEERNELYGLVEAERQRHGETEDKLTRSAAQRADLELQVKELEERVGDEEARVGELYDRRKRLERELVEAKDLVEEVEGRLEKTEKESRSKGDIVARLQEDLTKQDETVARLTREKKRSEDEAAKILTGLHEAEDKCGMLVKAKLKLEQGLDEAEEIIAKEKRDRAEVDKVRRKLETELKSCQAVVEEGERNMGQVQERLKSKEQELGAFVVRMEEVQAVNAGLVKRLKETQQRLEDTGEELEAERLARVKCEKQRVELKRELEELGERLEEAGGVTSAQMDLNKRREAELAKLRRDLDEANLVHEATATQLKRKHQEAVAEMSEQIDLLQKTKNKLEKDKQTIRGELEEVKSQADNITKAKMAYEKVSKQLESQLQDQMLRCDEMTRHVEDLEGQKNRVEQENNQLASQLEGVEAASNGLARSKQQLQVHIEELKGTLEEEVRLRAVLSQQIKGLNWELDQMREQIEDERELRVEAQKQLFKANGEASSWRAKFELEGEARAEELEEAKRKLALKLADAEEQMEEALAKCASLEKAKQRLSEEVEDLALDVERANASAASMEKKQRQFDKMIGDWKQKCEDITVELEASQKEARALSTEVFKLRSQYQEAIESIESLRGENKTLAVEIRDLVEQLGEDGRSVHELEKARRALQAEKDEMQQALEEADVAVEQEELKSNRLQLELSQVRQEIDRRLNEKQEEFENTRRNHARVVESMQASLEAESKGKAEAIRQKKKLEGDITEIEIGLDHANRNNVDLQKNNMRLQNDIEELLGQVENEHRQREEMQEALAAADRRVVLVMGEMEEIRASWEQSEKAKKTAELELHEAADRMSEMASQCASLIGNKRKLESENVSLQNDFDEAVLEMKSLEEKMGKVTMDAARIAEELRAEQEHSCHLEKHRKLLEHQTKDLQSRIEEAECNAHKGSRRIIQKLEQRIRELEADLDIEQKSHQDILKETRKTERRLKELTYKTDEDNKSQLRMKELVDRLQNKLRVYKRQLEETEEISQTNLNKYRKAQMELENVEERATEAEKQVNKLRAKSRCAGGSVVIGARSPGRSLSRAASVYPRATSAYRT